MHSDTVYIHCGYIVQLTQCTLYSQLQAHSYLLHNNYCSVTCIAICYTQLATQLASYSCQLLATYNHPVVTHVYCTVDIYSYRYLVTLQLCTLQLVVRQSQLHSDIVHVHCSQSYTQCHCIATQQLAIQLYGHFVATLQQLYSITLYTAASQYLQINNDIVYRSQLIAITIPVQLYSDTVCSNIVHMDFSVYNQLHSQLMKLCTLHVASQQLASYMQLYIASMNMCAALYTHTYIYIYSHTQQLHVASYIYSCIQSRALCNQLYIQVAITSYMHALCIQINQLLHGKG